MSKRGLREIVWGRDSDQRCIYDNGHLPPADFLAAVKAWKSSYIPADAREMLTEADVSHRRFRPMSPTEARSWGFDSGVVDTESGGYPVTRVIL